MGTHIAVTNIHGLDKRKSYRTLVLTEKLKSHNATVGLFEHLIHRFSATCGSDAVTGIMSDIHTIRSHNDEQLLIHIP